MAAAIAEPARARMLYWLVDGRARTSTELAIVAEVTPSTGSAHLQRLKALRLVTVVAQGRHRYYALDRPEVAAALEALSVLTGGSSMRFVPNTPPRLREARTCYDHIAGTLGVTLFERFVTLGWLSLSEGSTSLAITNAGRDGFASLDVDVEAARVTRRRLALACLDWSERRPHLGGALGAALLHAARRRRWIRQHLDSRILGLTAVGRRHLLAPLGIEGGWSHRLTTDC